MKAFGLMVILLGVLFALNGCGTMRGVGEDIEDAGDAISDAAR
jgi:predicted small secreted protein